MLFLYCRLGFDKELHNMQWHETILEVFDLEYIIGAFESRV